ncbi:hypothetical protein M0802_009318 [Mischocyttarus mexicanus]|nr:hypothetical protein M0802_009318 [Mischocyttarus mexicanus]
MQATGTYENVEMMQRRNSMVKGLEEGGVALLWVSFDPSDITDKSKKKEKNNNRNKMSFSSSCQSKFSRVITIRHYYDTPIKYTEIQRSLELPPRSRLTHFNNNFLP